MKETSRHEGAMVLWWERYSTMGTLLLHGDTTPWDQVGTLPAVGTVPGVGTNALPGWLPCSAVTPSHHEAWQRLHLRAGK